MAAFYFDFIQIQHISDDQYTFKAWSNKTVGTSSNTILTSYLPSKKLLYSLPNPATAHNEIVYPPAIIDFEDYYTYDAIHLEIAYPQYSNRRDRKGEFSIKDTDYPPPPVKGTLKNIAAEIMAIAPKSTTPAGVILDTFRFKSIDLTRVMDQTYNAKITLKHIGTPEYVKVGYSIEPDKFRKCFVLVLAVKKDGAAVNDIVFDDPTVFVSEETPVVIYDIANGPVEDIIWEHVENKNAHFAFD